jgi:hypothetical protein
MVEQLTDRQLGTPVPRQPIGPRSAAFVAEAAMERYAEAAKFGGAVMVSPSKRHTQQ